MQPAPGPSVRTSRCSTWSTTGSPRDGLRRAAGCWGAPGRPSGRDRCSTPRQRSWMPLLSGWVSLPGGRRARASSNARWSPQRRQPIFWCARVTVVDRCRDRTASVTQLGSWSTTRSVRCCSCGQVQRLWVHHTRGHDPTSPGPGLGGCGERRRPRPRVGGLGLDCALDRIRTYDLLLRRQTLYPLSYEGGDQIRCAQALTDQAWSTLPAPAPLAHLRPTHPPSSAGEQLPRVRFGRPFGRTRRNAGGGEAGVGD